MKCLVIGDLHIGRHRQRVEVPEAWRQYEIVIAVGDVLDRGCRDIECGRHFFGVLDDLELPTFVVPGNHDFQYYPSLIEGLPYVESVDETSSSLDGWTIYGLGSDRFDDGPEVRYPEVPELPSDSTDPESIIETVMDLASKSQSVGKSDNDTIDEDSFNHGLSLYRRRLETLENLTEKDSREILVSHLPPFGTGLDRLSETNPRYPGQAWGSLAIRIHLERSSPRFSISGHIHEAEGVARQNDTICLNTGQGTAYSINLSQHSIDTVVRLSDSL